MTTVSLKINQFKKIQCDWLNSAPTSPISSVRLATHMERSSIFVALLPILILALATSSRTNYPAVRAKHDAPQLLILNLKGRDGDKTSLAMQPHDLSLAGFSNRSGHWHAFQGHEQILPGSTPLPFGNSYRDLIGGLANLPNLPLGRPATLQATGALSSYSPPAAAAVDDDNGGVEALKRALAVLTVTTSEGQRLQPIRDVLTEGWTSGEARVAVEHLPYIEHWDTICYELLRADKNGGVWDGPFTELLRVHANIKSKEEALAVVGVIANRTLQDVLMAHASRA